MLFGDSVAGKNSMNHLNSKITRVLLHRQCSKRQVAIGHFTKAKTRNVRLEMFVTTKLVSGAEKVSERAKGLVQPQHCSAQKGPQQMVGGTGGGVLNDLPHGRSLFFTICYENVIQNKSFLF